MKKFKYLITRSIHFITVDIWRIPLEELPRHKSFLYRQLRVIMLLVRGLSEDKVQVRASALTYYTLLSIVPVLAMLFGIAKGFGLEARVTEELMKNFQGQQEVLNWAINFANRMLEITKGGFIAGFGLLLLFWAVIKVLSNVESALNNIWQIQKSRSFLRKFSDYMAILLLSPILMFISGSVTVFIMSRFGNTGEGNVIMEYLGPVVTGLIRVAPFFMMWIMFTMIYMIIPNTKVKFLAALLAGIVAGTLFQLVQWGYVHFQVGVSRYNAIYGSFAALPLFMIWLQVSWLIVLFGAELSFAYQNVRHYEFEADTQNIRLSLYKKVLILVSVMIIKRFAKGEKPLTSYEITDRLKLPIRLILRALNDLLEAGILVETVTDNHMEQGYLPAIDIHKITVHYVLSRWEKKGSHHIRIPDTHMVKEVVEIFDKMEDAAARSEGNKLLMDF